MRATFDEPSCQFYLLPEDCIEWGLILKQKGCKQIDKTVAGFADDTSHHPAFRIPELYWNDISWIRNPILNRWINAVQSAPAPIPIWEPDALKRQGLGLKPHQITGAQFLLRNAGKIGGMLGDEFGVGKTLTVLATYETARLQGLVQGMMVLCPKNCIEIVWWKQWNQYIEREYSPEFLPINYEQLIFGMKKIVAFIESIPGKIYLNLDEAHNLAGVSSKRFAALTDLLYQYRDKLFVTTSTGTPVRNKPRSFYSPYVLTTNAAISYKDFCNYVWQEQPWGGGPKNLPSVHSIYKRIGIRRTREEAGLNEIGLQQIPIRIEMTGKQKELYNKLKGEAKKEFEIIKGMPSLRDVRNKTLGILMKQATCCSHPAVWDPSFPDGEVAKMKALDEIIEQIGDNSVVVWSSHPKTLERVVRRYNDPKRDDYMNPVMIPGGLDSKEVKRRLDKFVQDPTCKMICLSSGACYQGIDGLQHKAFIAVSFDSSWSSVEFEQIPGRLRREGQNNTVYHFYLIYRETLDARMYDMVKMKLDQQSRIVSGKSYGELFDWASPEELVRMI